MYQKMWSRLGDNQCQPFQCSSRPTQMVFVGELGFLLMLTSSVSCILTNKQLLCPLYSVKLEPVRNWSSLNTFQSYSTMHSSRLLSYIGRPKQSAKVKITEAKRSGYSKPPCSSNFYHVTEEIKCWSKLNNTKYYFLCLQLSSSVNKKKTHTQPQKSSRQ